MLRYPCVLHGQGKHEFPWQVPRVPAGTIDFRVCQDAGTIRGQEQNKGGFS